MQREPWEQLAVLMRKLLEGGNLLTLEAAEQAFRKAPNEALQESEIQALVRSVRRRLVDLAHVADDGSEELVFSTDLWAAHPAEFVGSLLICQVHETGSDFDSASVDQRKLENPRITQAKWESDRLSADDGDGALVATEGRFDVLSSTICEATTRWQTESAWLDWQRHASELAFESCCSGAVTEDEEWMLYWRN